MEEAVELLGEEHIHTLSYMHALIHRKFTDDQIQLSLCMYLFIYVCMVTVFVVFDVLIIEFFFEPGTIDKCMWGGN